MTGSFFVVKNYNPDCLRWGEEEKDRLIVRIFLVKIVNAFKLFVHQVTMITKPFLLASLSAREAINVGHMRSSARVLVTSP